MNPAQNLPAHGLGSPNAFHGTALPAELGRSSRIRALDISYVRTAAEAEAKRDEGYEPIECAFGKQSVVGPLVLDHHGPYSGEEPVSIRAAKIALAPGFTPITKFVVTGMPDPDALYTMLALSGAVQPDLTVASALAELDVDPIGIDRRSEPYLRNAAYDMLGPPALSLEGYRSALERCAEFFLPEPLDADLADRAREFERARIERAKQAIVRAEGNLALVISDEPSRDIWHTVAAVVVQFKPSMRVVTFSGRSPAGAQRIGAPNIYDVAGKEGLTPIYQQLAPIFGADCGGRPDIGGSPRGLACSLDQAQAAFEKLKVLLP